MRRPVLLVLAALLVAGCTEVPTSSDPRRVESIPAGRSAAAAPGPTRNASPRQIVQGFLEANESTDFGHAAARRFLTAEASRRWKDNTVIVLDADDNVNYDAQAQQVTVTGAVVGTLGSTGIYTPSLQGVGDGGSPIKIALKVKQVGGQYRIDSLPNGLILGVAGYNTVYRPYALYFFDQDDRYLVPDLRASALDGRALQSWLIQQLAVGPRPSLVGTLEKTTFPVPATTEVVVTPGNPLRIAIPGSSRLAGASRNRLAAQLAYTLDPATSQSQNAFAITDAGKPLAIPDAGGTQFVVGQLSSFMSRTPAPDLYYLRGGRVTNATGRQLSGAIASGVQLDSFAISRRGGLQVAGVADAKLYIGTPSAGLTATTVTPVTSRPAWAPGLGEVWVAAGANVYRVTTAGAVQAVDIPNIPAGSQILALRFSPEGSRLAVVVSTPTTGTPTAASGPTQRLYVGSVVRAAGQASVATLQAISPEGVGVVDVSWIESTRLSAIGYLTGSLESRIFEANVDGSDWSARGIANLPGAPDYSTVVAGQLAWVSANGSVWEQSGSQWQPPGPGNPTPGGAPVYLE